MIYEELYRPAISEYLKKWETYFAKFHVHEAKGMNILQMREELDARKELLSKLESEKPETFDFNLLSALQHKFKSPVDAYAQAVCGVKAKYENARQELDRQHATDIASAEEIAESSVSDLTKKYDLLLTYKDKVADAIIRYGIKPSTMSIDEDALSREDMSALLDSALSACKFLGEDSLRKHLKVLYEPPEEGDRDTRLGQAGLVIVCVWLGAPVALALLFGYMFWHTANIYRKIDALRIADKLMYGINFAKFRDAPNLEAIPDVNYAELDAAEQEELERLSSGDPSKVMEELQREINKNHSRIAEDYRAATNQVMSKYDSLLRIFTESVKMLQGIVDEYLANLKDFGTVCSLSHVMDTQFVLGKQKGMVDVRYDVGLRNIIFADRSPGMLLFTKLMLANAMLSVRPKQFKCLVYDPEGLGADFATYMSQDTSDYISVATNDFNKHLDAHRAYSQNNLRILDQMDINTFNADAEEKGIVTLEYHLLIIVSGVDKPLENKILTEFMQFSARTGAMVWLVSPEPVAECTFYKTPFDTVQEPYPLSAELFNRVMRTYLDAFTTLKDTGILYKPAFADKYLPEENWWQENTDKGIKLNMGLQDGDPSKGFAIELGDGAVHGLCVGATGAGKSAFNNQLVASLITRYPPSALELIMVDFKNIEFASLTDKATHISRIPHAKIIAGTKDGEYAISIFDYLMQEMARRTEIFDKASEKKLEDYNKKMRVLGTPEKCLPRILLIIDEFQVMFTEVDVKSVDIIQSRIRSLAKLARFCGCHMLFTSQSMKGTMPKDIMDQFALRIALRCSSDTSSEIIGSPIASRVKSTFGYLYTNTNMGETQDSTRMWRTPFIPNSDLFEILDKVEALCVTKKENHHRAYFYNENEMYSDSKLIEWFEEHHDIVEKEERLVVLGERTNFSLKKAPINFRLKRGDGENVLFYAFEETDFNNICMTLVDNIRANPRAQLLLNCADPDIFTVLSIDEWYRPELLDIAHPMSDVTDWLETLSDMIEARQGEDPTTYVPLYFLCLRWDKQLGICRDENYKLTDAWKSILTRAPAVDIHIVFGVQLFKEVQSNVVSLFNHIICARGPEDAGYKYMGGSRLAKLPDTLGFGLYQYGTSVQKFKLYQHTFAREAESREIDV